MIAVILITFAILWIALLLAVFMFIVIMGSRLVKGG